MGRVTIEIEGVEYVACRGYGDQVIFFVGQRGRRFRALCGEALEQAAKAQWMV